MLIRLIPPSSLPFSSLLLVLFSLGWAAPADAKPKASKESAAEDVKLDDEESTAQEEGSEEAAPAEAEESADADGEAKTEDGEKSGEAAGDAAGADTAIAEAPGKSYYFVGARVRAVVIPSFIIEAFGEGGQTVVGPMIGPEFAIRRDGFEYNFALSYTAYPMDRTPFKAPTDPVTSMELVESRIKVLYATADFMWSHHFSPAVALTYGGGAGLGFVWGPLYRAQAYPVGAGWELCPGPPTAANPGPNPAYCAPDPTLSEQRYGAEYEEKNWADGGSKPLVMPWLAVQMGLRWKPHRNFVTRAEFGIGLGQVFLGLGADYGL